MSVVVLVFREEVREDGWEQVVFKFKHEQTYCILVYLRKPEYLVAFTEIHG